MDFPEHPASIQRGIMTFHEFSIAYDYVVKKLEVIDYNRLSGSHPHLAASRELPAIPKFTANPNENYSHVLDVTENFVKNARYLAAINREEGSENDSLDSGFHGQPTHLSNYYQPIESEPHTFAVLLTTFDNLCINLINRGRCNWAHCLASHTPLSREDMAQKLMTLSDKQINDAFILVGRSKFLNKSYFTTFITHSLKLKQAANE